MQPWRAHLEVVVFLPALSDVSALYGVPLIPLVLFLAYRCFDKTLWLGFCLIAMFRDGDNAHQIIREAKPRPFIWRKPPPEDTG